MRRAYVYTLITVVVWTTGPIGAKAALLAVRDGARLTPMEVSFWPVAIGWVGLAGLVLAQRRAALIASISARGWAVLIAMGLFGWVGYQFSLNYAYVRLGLPEALIISYLNPIFVVIFHGRAFGAVMARVSGWEQRPEVERRPSGLRLAVGLALGLLGVAVIATGGRLSTVQAPSSIAGAVAALFAALAWGVYSNLGRFVAVKPGHDARGLADVQNATAMALGVAAMAAVLAGTGAFGSPGGFTTAFYLGPKRFDVSVWAPFAAMGILNYALGYTLWLRAVEEGHRLGEAHKLPPLTYLTLIFAIAGGWLLLRQPIGPGFWQGGALIALSNLVTVWPERDRAAGKEPTHA